MSQTTSGLRAIFSNSRIFDAFQSVLGGAESMDKLVSQYLKITDGQSVLDIGCGTAEILAHLPEGTHYVGFDLSDEYIAAAKQKFSGRGEFFIQQIGQESLPDNRKYDRVIATGVLHHLDDKGVIELFRTARERLKADGWFCSIDPCFISGQSWISRLLVGYDRGQNVRQFEDYEKLAKQVFENVSITHRNNMLKVPYDHAILVCR